jgi:hypothetical protein
MSFSFFRRENIDKGKGKLDLEKKNRSNSVMARDSVFENSAPGNNAFERSAWGSSAFGGVF